MSKRVSPLLIAAGVGVGFLAASQAMRARRLAESTNYFAGKVALVTGASRGLGRALAIEMALRDAHLVLAARSAEALEATAAACEALGPSARIEVIPTDLAQPDQREALMQAALERFGRVDVLLNNAGMIIGAPFNVTEQERIAQLLEVNFNAPLHLIRLALPGMLERRSGHIVNIASQVGRIGFPLYAAYSATKGALVSFGQALRRELLGTGVHLLTVNPGFTNTSMLEGAPAEFLDAYGFPILSPEIVARRTAEAMILDQGELHLGSMENVGVWANRLSPRIMDFLWARISDRAWTMVTGSQRPADLHPERPS